jgi:subtilase family serine protease
LVADDVKLITPATAEAGPAYRVKFHNEGTGPANEFNVTVYRTIDGRLSDDARTNVDVPALAAGQASEVTVRLPLSTTKATTGGAVGRLVISIDPDNAVVETNKSNNLLFVDMTTAPAK